MILAISTSSPQASVALISHRGEALWSGEELAPQRASGACMKLLERCLKETACELGDVAVFAADLGPGSFTGVRVGVTLAKTLAYTQGAQTAGLDAFDLIDSRGTVLLPSKRGEFFVRYAGKAAFRTTDLPLTPFVGYGVPNGEVIYPHASSFAGLIGQLEVVAPELLVPRYLIEPSISIPKKLSGGAANAPS